MKQAVGYIKTTLEGSGKAKLHFGNCYIGNGVRKIPMNPKLNVPQYLKASGHSPLLILNLYSSN